MTFGEKVKFVREKLFLSQVNMAKELGVAPLAVIRWEQDKTKPNYNSQRAFYNLCEKHNIFFDEDNQTTYKTQRNDYEKEN